MQGQKLTFIQNSQLATNEQLVGTSLHSEVGQQKLKHKCKTFSVDLGLSDLVLRES